MSEVKTHTKNERNEMINGGPAGGWQSYYHGITLSLGRGYVDELTSAEEYLSEDRSIVWEKVPRMEEIGGYEGGVFREEGIEIGQVLCYKPALELLSRLYEDKVVLMDEINKSITGEIVVSVGILVGARMCSVSPVAIRITDYGERFVSQLIEVK